MKSIVSIVGWHNSGKTTFAERLVRLLKARGLRVAVIKHSREGMDTDRPGTDTWRLAQAGSDVVAISSESAMAWFERPPEELSLQQLVARLPDGIDLVITEGYKREPTLKIEVMRSETGTTPIATESQLLAIVSDDVEDTRDVPRFSFDQVEAVATLLVNKGLLPDQTRTN